MSLKPNNFDMSSDPPKQKWSVVDKLWKFILLSLLLFFEFFNPKEESQTEQ
jgi:hypothetical protein